MTCVQSQKTCKDRRGEQSSQSLSFGFYMHAMARDAHPTLAHTHIIINKVYIILKLVSGLEVQLSVRGPRLTPPAPRQQSKKPGVHFQKVHYLKIYMVACKCKGDSCKKEHSLKTPVLPTAVSCQCFADEVMHFILTHHWEDWAFSACQEEAGVIASRSRSQQVVQLKFQLRPA